MSVSFKITTSPIGVKAFVLRIIGVVTRVQALVAASFLTECKEAGARGLLEFQESADALLFTYDGTTAQGYDAGVYAGVIQS
jgi:hypothetical protein